MNSLSNGDAFAALIQRYQQQSSAPSQQHPSFVPHNGHSPAMYPKYVENHHNQSQSHQKNYQHVPSPMPNGTWLPYQLHTVPHAAPMNHHNPSQISTYDNTHSFNPHHPRFYGKNPGSGQYNGQSYDGKHPGRNQYVNDNKHKEGHIGNSYLGKNDFKSSAFSNNQERSKKTMYCEACDREMSKSAYEAHIATHEKCTHPGCQYSATSKILQAHILSVHGSGNGSGFQKVIVENQEFRVLYGKNPEEVELWKAERRNKFPTAANIDAKRQQRAALQAAGGIVHDSNLKTKTFAKRNRDEFSEQTAKRTRTVDHTVELSSQCESGEIKENTESLSQSEANEVEDEVLDQNSKIAKESKEITRRVCQQYLRGKCRFGKRCKFLHQRLRKPHDSTEPSTSRDQGVGERDKSSAKTGNVADTNNADNKAILTPSDVFQNKRKGKRQNGLFLPDPLSGGANGTLLHHLLRDSIEKEEDLVLQAIRFIAQNIIAET